MGQSAYHRCAAPPDCRRPLLFHFRRFLPGSPTAWQKMGSPQNPDKVQYAALEKAGQLARTREAEWVKVEKGKYDLKLDLPQQSMVLLKLSW